MLMNEARPIDVLTLGETMVRLVPKGFTRLEEAQELECRIGGSESNVAVALTRLGLQVSWISKLPANPLGVMIERRVRSFGVDTSRVIWEEGGRAGVYFIEPGASPRPARVLYDRANSSASRLAPTEIEWSVLDSVRHVHLTGITPALSDSCRATVARALAEAQARGCTTSFDVNYRAKLWPADVARHTLEPLLAGVDVLITPLADAELLWGLPAVGREVAIALRQAFKTRAVVVTMGGEGALCHDGQERTVGSFPVREIDRVGAGDAFDAGLLYGFLRGDLDLGMAYGMAMAALKHTIPGDEFVATKEEVEALLAGGATGIHR
jgi:2-dehydro-3-deoxygluconokinase